MVSRTPTIFVQIASYRDPECQWTVKDLFEKAQYPDQVTVGVCAQADPVADKDCFIVPSPRPAQTKITLVPPQESRGVCWARALTQQLFEDQDYVLMIDSHMRFIQNWDTELIAELARCASPKAFLSTYPPGYKPPDKLDADPKPVVMRAQDFKDGEIRFEGEMLATTPETPLRGAFLAAGLLFAPGTLVREIPYDPHIYFNQEEITLAARAFTHGWDVYAPTKAFVYHYYNEPDKGEVRPLHWHDRQDWTQFQALSRARADYLLTGNAPSDPAALDNIASFGLGRVRSLQDFEAFCGLDFRNKVSTERARTSQFIDGLDRYRAPAVVESPAPLLKVGECLAPVALTDIYGAARTTAEFAGAPCFLCILPASFDGYIRDFMEKLQNSPAPSARLVFIAPVPSEQAADYAARNFLADDLLVDSGLQLVRLFGYQARIHDTPVTVALDASQVVRGVFDNRNAANHFADLNRAAAALSQSS